MRVAVEWRSASRENFRLFRKKHPSIKITYDQFTKIIYGYNESYRDYLLETGDKEKFPMGLGEFAVLKRRKRKTRIVDGREVINLPIDWKKTKEKGKLIYQFNYHTEGFSFRWYWFKKPAKFKFSDLWYFRAMRVNSRLINHYIKIDNNYQHIYKEWNLRKS